MSPKIKSVIDRIFLALGGSLIIAIFGNQQLPSTPALVGEYIAQFLIVYILGMAIALIPYSIYFFKGKKAAFPKKAYVFSYALSTAFLLALTIHSS